MKNIERDKYTTIIHQELKTLDEEFKRYKNVGIDYLVM